MKKHKHKTLEVLGWKVTDGDTISLTLDLQFRLMLETNARIAGIDTPEISDSRQHLAAVKAQNAAREWCRCHAPLTFISHGPDKYEGRSVGDIEGKGESLAKWLLAQGYARVYDGGHKAEWTSDELSRIERLP